MDRTMTDVSTDHGTIVVEHVVDVPVSRAYAAFADAQERARWGAPSETAVFIYEETDFSVGGRDVARCGARNDPKYRVEARYLDIVNERRVVWTETIGTADRLLATNITTLDFRPDGRRTRLKVTIQVTSFVGPGMIENTRAGHQGSLANMARYLEAVAT
ncbi:MAG TPA: SRPBCC domain-containing protein [Xanthobacteraceae bacterium]|nr:SRPBCC domain-containing protein [Xanthobacteraceae bacterium]